MRRAVVAVAAVAAILPFAACSSPRPAAGPPPSRTEGLGARTTAGCYNVEYGFTCVPPRGFVITQEGPGPGTVLTLVKRSQSAAEEPNLSVRAYPIRATLSLKAYVRERVIGQLKSAEGVERVDSSPRRLGEREGIEVRYGRSYANGTFSNRIFCFQHSDNVFLVKYAAPSGRDDPSAFTAFVSSLAFR